MDHMLHLDSFLLLIVAVRWCLLKQIQDLNRVIGQVHHMCCAAVIKCLCMCVSVRHTRAENVTKKHLLAGEELPLVLVDDGVTCGHGPILIPSNWTQEVSWVGQTIGSYRTQYTRRKKEKDTFTNNIRPVS